MASAPARDPVLALGRPHRNLLIAYLLRALATGPGALVLLPLLYFRYHTLRYRFDEEGVSMRWGILFRREVNLTYARIQDIHLTSGPVLRWLGLADVHVQTAAGSASAEMKIEGLREFEAIRDFLYGKMRGSAVAPAEAPPAGDAPGDADELVRGLRAVRDELRATRGAIERLAARDRDDGGC